MPRQRLQVVNNPFLLLCEGVHDREFFQRLIKVRGISDFTVCSNYGMSDGTGNTAFKDSLDALTIVSDFEAVEAVLIATDADADTEETFRLIQKQIEQTAGILGPPPRRYPIPSAPLVKASGKPSIVVMLIPWMDRAGNLETICLDAMTAHDRDAARCVEEFVACTGAGDRSETKLAKLKLRVFLAAASRDEPDVSLARVWSKPDTRDLISLSHPAFNQIANFLCGFRNFISQP